MGVEVQYVHVAVHVGEAGHHREAHHMVAAKEDRHRAGFGGGACCSGNAPTSSSVSSSGRSPQSSSAMWLPISRPLLVAMLPCSEASAARIAAGAAAAPRMKEEWLSVGSPTSRIFARTS